MRCKDCQEMMVEALYEELGEERLRAFEEHVGSCSDCSGAYAEMRSTLRTMDRRERPDPGQAYWDGYWNRLKTRMEPAEPRGWRRWLTRPVWGGPRWAYRGAAAVVLIAMGIVVGRMIAPTPMNERPTGPAPESIIRTASVEERAMQYLESSQVLLLAIVNSDPETDRAYAADWSAQRRLSRRLMAEVPSLESELTDPKQRRLRALVAELELILMQIANLEAEDDPSAVEFIRSSVNDKDVLLKIDLEQLRSGKEPAANRPADSKGSI